MNPEEGKNQAYEEPPTSPGTLNQRQEINSLPPGAQLYRAIPRTVKAVQATRPVIIPNMAGNQYGEPEDFILQGIDGKLTIMSKEAMRVNYHPEDQEYISIPKALHNKKIHLEKEGLRVYKILGWEIYIRRRP